MQIYISTPINARKEPSFSEKLQAAKQRVEHLKQIIQDDKRFAAYNHIVHTNFDGSVKSEAVAMGICILSVLVCDAIYMDSGWQSSKGCSLEYHAAKIYGKTIYEHETVTSTRDNSGDNECYAEGVFYETLGWRKCQHEELNQRLNIRTSESGHRYLIVDGYELDIETLLKLPKED